MAQLSLRMPVLCRASLLLCLMLIACGHDDGPAVPFKLGEQQATAVDNPDEATSETPSAVTPATNAERVGPSITEGSRAITLGSRALAVSNGVFVAALAVDLDGDGNDDALAMTLDQNNNVVLQRALHGATQVEAIKPLKPLHTLAKGCRVDPNRARLTSISTGYVVATIEVACAATERGVGLPDAMTELDWIIGVATAPRVMEQVRLLPDPQSNTATALALTMQARDIDNDKNDDVVATLKITSLDGVPSEVSLRWMNRVGGLDLDRAEPEATLAAKLTAAKRLRADERTRALREITATHDLLCRESGRARVMVGDRVGITCGRSKATGNAWALLTKTYAEAYAPGNDQALLSALDAFEHVGEAFLAVDATERASAEQALKTIGAKTRWQWQAGPNIASVRAPEVHLPAIGFLNDTTLLLRGTTQQTYDVGNGTFTDVNEAPGDLLLRDPSGAFAVVDVERHCDGYRLKVVRAEQVSNGLVLGPSVSEPLIEPRTAPATAGCDRANPSYRGDNDGRWTVLGWAPSAIVMTTGRAVYTLSLDAMAHVTGEPTTATFRLPAPSAPGALAMDGSAYATLTGVGILVFSERNGAVLVEPLGPVSDADLAVAPNATRLAYVFGDRVFIGTPATP